MANFCTNCGAQLNENGVCTNCGAVYTIASETNEQTVQQNYAAYEQYPAQENQVFVDDNGVYVDANGNPLPTEYFQPVDLSEYGVPQQDYQPTEDYAQQDYQPTADYAQQDYQPTGDYAQQNYQPTADYAQQNYQPTADYAQQNYQPTADYAQQNYQPTADYAQQNYQPTVQHTMPMPIKEWLDNAKLFFTNYEPSNAVDNAMNGTNHSWAIFAGLNAIFAALCLSGVVGNGFNRLIETMFGSYTFMSNFIEGYSFGQMAALFFVSLIAFAVLFFAVSACEYLFLAAVQKKTAFEDIFKVIAISFFPMTIACAAAFIFSFIWIPVAAVLLITGFIASIMLLNESVKKAVGDVPFWGMVLNNIAQVVIAMIIISIALAISL